MKACIDGRELSPQAATGTGVYAAELLSRLPGARVYARERAQFPALAAQVLTRPEELAGCDVFHRPSQFFDRAMLELYLSTPARKVITYLDLIAYRTPALFGSFAAFEAYRADSRASLRASDAVVAISEHGRREIVEEFGLAPERVHAIPLGVDQAFLSRPSAPLFERPYFFYCGGDFPHKNLPLLLRAFAWLRSSMTDTQLVLAGPRSHGLFTGPGVTDLGPVSREKLASLYQHAVALVHLSAYEGFGLTVAEAMAAGTPVICGRLTSLPEVAGDAALYLDEFSLDEIADRMRSVAGDAALRARLIEAGRARAALFRWEETARRTAEVYAAVTARG